MNKNIILLLTVIVLFVFAAGCTQQTSNVSYVNISDIMANLPAEKGSDIIENVSAVTEKPAEVTNIQKEEPKKEEQEAMITINAVEGDLVSLKPKAYDPDNDNLTIKYSKPFNADGKWQTKTGDAGSYFVDVTVSDGELSTTQKVRVVVMPKNKPPVIEMADTITVNEGETVKLEPKIYDPDNDSLRVAFSGWMSSAEKTTTYSDAGEYEVMVTASDGKAETTKKVKVIVKNFNRPPLLDLKAQDVVEGDTAKIIATTSDPDGDSVKIIYPAPFNEKGEWQTKTGDAGTYKLLVKAYDGKDEVAKELTLVVSAANHPPTIEIDEIIRVKEGETVRLKPVIKDEDNDTVTVIYSGWMSSAEKTTTYSDAGNYTVTITASDGKTKTVKNVKVVVENVNRPPVITGFE